jgi:methylmalonyl-CoA mutase cobalamin-binding domain/chain
MEQIFAKIAEAIRYGNKEEIEKLADEIVANKINPVDAIQRGGVAGLDKLGKDFENLEAFLPELMAGGETMKVLISKLTPYLEEGKSALAGTVVIGTVKGDLHDIGKNLVATTLSVNGFNVIDLGVDVNNNKFIEEAKANNADIIALSSLLTTSAYYIDEFINRLKEDGLRSNYKIVVGGGPIEPEWAKEIHADGYSRTAVGAVKVCKELMKADQISETIIDE